MADGTTTTTSMVLDMERDITAWIATILGLTVDAGIFRGGIPEGVDEGVGVLFNGVAGGSTELDVTALSVQVLGRFRSRDSAVLTAWVLSRAFPAFGETLNGRTFVHSAVQDGSIQPYMGEDRGRTAWFSSVNLTVSAAFVG